MTAAAKPTVLILQRYRFLTRVLRTALEKAGYAIVVTSSGEDALKRIRHEDLAALIVDADIRPMSGEEFCRRVQSDRPERRFETCVLSSSAEDEHPNYVQWFTRFRIFPKPISTNEILRHLERCQKEAA